MKNAKAVVPSELTFHPLTPGRWHDFEMLFGKKGAYGGCWCMWWRITRSEFEKQKGDGNRSAMKAIVDSGEIPGIMAYRQKTPVGWCSVAPRDRFPSLNRSPVLKKIDDTPVWSIVCFYVPKNFQNRGMTSVLIQAAVEYVKQRGGKVVEAYPTDPRGRRLAPVSSFMGLPAIYRKAGFSECARPSKSKVVMRYRIDTPISTPPCR